jgi:hypothetical protein
MLKNKKKSVIFICEEFYCMQSAVSELQIADFSGNDP